MHLLTCDELHTIFLLIVVDSFIAWQTENSWYFALASSLINNDLFYKKYKLYYY